VRVRASRRPLLSSPNADAVLSLARLLKTKATRRRQQSLQPGPGVTRNDADVEQTLRTLVGLSWISGVGEARSCIRGCGTGEASFSCA